jgi:hypothetical protein
MKPKVAIAVMSYRALNMEVHHSLFWNYKHYGAENISLLRAPKATEIHRARSMVANSFLASDNEYLIMVDDDMLLPFGNEDAFSALMKQNGGGAYAPNAGKVSALSRIMEHGPDIGIVGALYVSRGADRNPMVWDVNVEPSNVKAGNISGLHKCRWLATGFIRIHRSVFQRMIDGVDKFPEIKPAGPKGTLGHYYGFFVPRQNHMGEDASFMHRANMLGIQSYLDADIKCGHVGEYIYAPGQT